MKESMKGEARALQKLKLKKVTEEKKDLIYEQRETLIGRLPYCSEREALSYIRDGKVGKLRSFLVNVADTGIYVGNLSDDALRQEKYVAVSFITLAARAVIEGGFPEAQAFCLSDEFIHCMDGMDRVQDVCMLIYQAMLEFTRRARENRRGGTIRSEAVQTCVNYIDTHLHYKISLADLSGACGLSPSHLSRLFRRETGTPPSVYIAKRKLREARALLAEGKLDSSAVANVLGFCSQSYFIECFKKEYGVTPGEFRRNRK